MSSVGHTKARLAKQTGGNNKTKVEKDARAGGGGPLFVKRRQLQRAATQIITNAQREAE